MFCPNCGKQLPDGSRFCDGCGAQLAAAQPIQQQPLQQQPVQQPYMHQQPVQQPYMQQPNAYAQPAKKTPWGLIGGVAAAAVLAVVLFVYPGVLRSDRADTAPAKQEQASPVQQQAPAAPSDSNTSAPPQDTQNVPNDSNGGLTEPAPPTEPPTEPTEPVEPQPSSTDPVDGAVVSVDPVELPGPDQTASAAFYSTDADAAALEFDWFLDLILADGAVFAEMFQNAEDVTDPALLEGGWKAYMRGNGEYDNDAERYLHADLTSSGGNGRITLRWKYLFIPSSGQSIVEEGSSAFSGTWEGGLLYATSAVGNLKLDRFFSADGKQYAYGSFLWNSGEVDYIALMRP